MQQQTRKISKTTESVSLENNSFAHEIINLPYKIDKYTYNYFESRVVLLEVFDCIRRASTFGGEVFGGFVRDVIVPHLNGSKDYPYFKDVDIWFKTNLEADSFLSSMKLKTRVQTGLIKAKSNGEASLGNFSRQFCLLVKYGVLLAKFDVIVAEELPVNDFDVNTVTYSFGNDVWTTKSPNYLIERISQKKATMLPSYAEKIKKAETYETPFDSYYKRRIDRIFIGKGWTVYEPLTLNKPILDIQSSFKFVETMKRTGRLDLCMEFINASTEKKEEIFNREYKEFREFRAYN